MKAEVLDGMIGIVLFVLGAGLILSVLWTVDYRMALVAVGLFLCYGGRNLLARYGPSKKGIRL